MLPCQFGKLPRVLRQLLRRLMASSLMNFITSLRERHALVAVVRNAQLEQRVGEAHDAQADLAIALAHLVDLGPADTGSRRSRCPGTEPTRAPPRPGRPSRYAALPLSTFHERPDVDAAQIAGLVRQQRLLAARIRRLDPPELRRRIVLVDPIDEHHPRLARRVGVANDDIPQIALRVNRPSDRPVFDLTRPRPAP